MPAIRFRYHHGNPVATQAPGPSPVELLKKDGTWQRASFGGFICKPGLKMVPGTLAKMAARMVTNGNPVSGLWRDVQSDEGVLVYVVDRFGEADDSIPLCYAVVNRDGWPIVIPLDKKEPPPRQPATVVKLRA